MCCELVKKNEERTIKISDCEQRGRLWVGGFHSGAVEVSILDGCGSGYFSWYSDLLRAGRSWDRIPVVGEISHTRPDRPWSPPSPLYNVYRVFPWGRRPVRGVDHPSPSSVEVKERVQLYLYSPFEPSRPVLWWTLPLPWSLFLMDVAPHQRGIGVRRTPVTQWLMPNPIRTHTTKLDSLTKRFSNCGPRTTSGPRVLPLWSF